MARGLAKLFTKNNQEVVCIDSNAENCQAAENNGIRVIYGNGLQAFVFDSKIEAAGAFLDQAGWRCLE